MSEWQPIETAPKTGAEFLTFMPDAYGFSPFDVAGYCGKDDEFWKVGCGYQYATHWHPISDDWQSPDTAPEDVAFLGEYASHGTRVFDPEDSWSYSGLARWQPLPATLPPSP